MGKEDIKLLLFAGGMILYVGESRYSTKILLELIKEFGKVAGLKLTHKNQ